MPRPVSYGMSEESYNTFLEQGRSAPCNGCEHEDYCRTGYTCQMYRKWESMRGSEWKKHQQNYSKAPDQPYG